MLQSLIALRMGMRQCKIPSACQLVVDEENGKTTNNRILICPPLPLRDVTHTVSTRIGSSSNSVKDQARPAGLPPRNGSEEIQV